MTRLEALETTAAVRGILPGRLVFVVSVRWYGSEALELTYKGPIAHELRYRHDEQRLQIVEAGRSSSFDGRLFRLGFRSAPHSPRACSTRSLAVHTSSRWRHQNTVVWEAMLPRQPLRFLLPDDPGARKRAWRAFS